MFIYLADYTIIRLLVYSYRASRVLMIARFDGV